MKQSFTLYAANWGKESFERSRKNPPPITVEGCVPEHGCLALLEGLLCIQ